MKKAVSTRFYVENEGVKNENDESLEQAFVQLLVDGEILHDCTMTIEAYVAEEADNHLWDALEKQGFDLDELAAEIDFDPFTLDYAKRKGLV